MNNADQMVKKNQQKLWKGRSSRESLLVWRIELKGIVIETKIECLNSFGRK